MYVQLNKVNNKISSPSGHVDRKKCNIKKYLEGVDNRLGGIYSDSCNLATVQLLKNSEITARASNYAGISKADVIYLKTHRPPYAEGQVDAVWDAAPKDSLGRAICPNSGKKIAWTKGEPRQGVWDMGHKAGHEYRTLWEKLATCQINYATFIAEYQDPNNYQVEDYSANRSHLFEA